MKSLTKLVIYQTKSGALELKGDFEKETIWATQAQIVRIFGVDQSVVSRHIKNITTDREIDIKRNMQKMHIPNSDKDVLLYSLDVILAVGYRTNSSRAIQFRQWATKTLKQHIINGFTISRKRIKTNYELFLKAVADVKALLPSSMEDKANITELIKAFASTWLSLDAYDKSALPSVGATKREVIITSEELTSNIIQLKQILTKQNQAGDLFAIERGSGLIEGIIGNVFQSFANEDVYPSVELKAANLLYFMVKNHPFADGNKRSGAFAFIWFLKKAKILNMSRLSPEAVTAITLLVAESKSQDKARVIGLILCLLM